MSEKYYTVGRPIWLRYQFKASHLRVYMKNEDASLMDTSSYIT